MRATPAPILVVAGPSGVGHSTVSGLVAAAVDRSAHIRIDDLMPFVVNGWVEPWRPESAHQNDVVGGAVAAAAIELAVGGYVVVLDGHLFPGALAGLARACGRRGVPLHYAVLRAEVTMCLARATRRAGCDPPDRDLFEQLHARYADLGAHERNVVDATGTAEAVAAAMLSAFRSGTLVQVVRP